MISEDKFSSGSSIIYAFGDFQLETGNLLLQRNNEVIPLAPKALEVLLTLVEAGGRLITKQEILEKVWKDTFVEEANLTHHISALRKALGEDKNGRRFIETIPRKGYRFAAEVKKVTNSLGAEIIFNERTSVQVVEEIAYDSGDLASQATVAANLSTPNVTLLPPPSSTVTKRLLASIFAALIFLLLGAAAFFGWQKFNSASKNITAAAPREMSIKRLTPDADAIAPSVSPDGLSVVFSRDEKGQGILWRKSLATGEMMQLLPAASKADQSILYTRFSPDGKWIYYGSADLKSASIFRIPANGGSPQKVVEEVFNDFAISPDGKQLAYCFDFRQIIVADLETGEKRIIAERDDIKQAFKGDDFDSVAWSPDGSKLAVAGAVFDGQRNIQQLLEIDVKTGAVTAIPVAKDFKLVRQIEWPADDSGLIVTQAGRIAFVNRQTGNVENITSESDSFSNIRLSANSKTLIATRNLGHYNIWTAPADNIDKRRQITIGAAARQGAWGLAVLSDARIVYTTPESGMNDIWSMNEDGSQPRQLTINAASNSRPQTTRDGRQIIFLSSRSGTSQVWRMEPDGHNPAQLSQGQESWEYVLGPDDYVYYLTHPADGKNYQIYKVPVTGGEPIKVGESVSPQLPQFSPNGKWFLRWGGETGTDQPTVALMETQSGKFVRSYKKAMSLPRWSRDSKLIYFCSPDGQEFWQQPSEGEPKKLYDFRPMKIASFNFSADDKKIVFSLGTSTSEVVSIENFLDGKIK